MWDDLEKASCRSPICRNLEAYHEVAIEQDLENIELLSDRPITRNIGPRSPTATASSAAGDSRCGSCLSGWDNRVRQSGRFADR